jgi:hypothetical protein
VRAKACIAKETQRHDFPDKKSVDGSYTHNLRELMKVAKLDGARLQDVKVNPLFRDNWDLVQHWSEQSRYQRQGFGVAEALIKAISDRNNGVLAWIKRRW